MLSADTTETVSRKNCFEGHKSRELQSPGVRACGLTHVKEQAADSPGVENEVWMDPQQGRKSSSPWGIREQPQIHHSEPPPCTVQGCADPWGSTPRSRAQHNSPFSCHTLDSGLFMEFPVSFSFSGSAFVCWACLASLSCLLRIRYTAPKHRKAPTSKKNCSPRYLWVQTWVRDMGTLPGAPNTHAQALGSLSQGLSVPQGRE